MSMSARLKSFLDENKVQYTLMSHSPAYTAQAAAATLHVPGKELAKTVVLRAGEETVLAVLPASFHVDLKALSGVVGKTLRLATEQEFGDLFPDCELGAMPPLGNLYNLRVFVDESLAADEEIVFNAGTHRDAIRMRYADFARLARPTVTSLAATGKARAAE
jgi:Ala-tRNA(Pro) deacylase